MPSTLVATTIPPYNQATVYTPVAADKTNGNKIVYSPETILIVNETGGTNTLTATLTSNTDSSGMSKTVAITAVADGFAFIGPLENHFNINGYLEVVWTDTGTGTISPIQARGVV